MTKATQTALDREIFHWEEELDKENPADINIGISQCALCDIFYGHPDYCSGCPIAEHTGRIECRNSPYQRAFKMLNRWLLNPESKDARAAWRVAAQEMIDFMKSLRETVK